MKYLVVNLPFWGHISPTLKVVEELIKQGNEVSYILCKQYEKTIDATGATFIPYDDFPKNPSQFEIRKKSWVCAYNTAMRVGENYDCILYEMLFFLGDSLAKNLNLPSIRFFFNFRFK